MSRRFDRQSAAPGVLNDPGRGMTFDWGTAAPSASAVGYAPGAQFIDVVTGTWYRNTGTKSSATWAQVSGSALSSQALADGAMLNTTTNNGATIAGNANQKLAFWGATPIVQPAGVAEAVGVAGLQGSGVATTTYVANTTNFNGNTGSKAYTINDIVKGLKAAGILAAS